MPSRRSPSTSNKASPKSAISRRESRSTAKSSAASTPRIGSPRARAKYVDTGIQTDYDEGGSPLSLAKHSPRPSFIPLTKRLLCRYRDAHLRLDASNESNDISLKDSMPPPPPVVSAKAPLSPDDEKDVEMKDADTSITPSAFVNLTPPSSSHEMTAPAEFVTKPDSSPLPSTLAHYIPVRHLSDYQPEPTQSPQQHMPDVPLSTPPATSSSPRPQEPSSIKLPAITATRASGLGITAPSPVKKRMSLNDYMSRRGNLAAPSGEKHVSPSPLSTHQRTPPVVPNPTTSINPMETGQTEATTNKPIEAIKHENDVTPDTVMKDVSSLPVYMDSSSNLSMLTRDPRLNPPT